MLHLNNFLSKAEAAMFSRRSLNRLTRLGTFLLIAMLTWSCGNGGSATGDGWKTIVDGIGPCSIEVYSPAYGTNSRTPDTVTVLWDGRQLFNGMLPSNTSGFDGIPVRLLEIHAAPGTHTIEIKSKGLSQTESIKIDQGNRVFLIFGFENGKEVLLQDLGNSAGFLSP